MGEERKQQYKKQVKEWLAKHYRDSKSQRPNDDDLNTIVWNWCKRNNLTNSVFQLPVIDNNCHSSKNQAYKSI